jgi:hypothetical protein
MAWPEHATSEHEMNKQLIGVAICLLVATHTFAQQAPPAQPQQQQQTPQPPQQVTTWEGMPRMELEQQFAGPLKDTTIQRWRDPQTGFVCYAYLPFTAQHTPPTATGYVQYGANTIGSISCLQPAASPARAESKASNAQAPKRNPSQASTPRTGSAGKPDQ